MLGEKLRAKIIPVFYQIGKLISKTGINPNVFTSMAILFAIGCAISLYMSNYPLGFLFFVFATVWDMLDGSVARAQKKASKFGNYFDAMIDKYVDSIIYFGFFLAGYKIEAFIVVVGSLILSYAKPRAAMVINIDNKDWPGIGDRADRMVLAGIVLLFGIFFPDTKIMGYSLISISLLFIGAVLFIGSIQRIIYAYKIIKMSD